MARTVNQIFTQITNLYVSAMAAIGITITPSLWSRRNKQQLALNTFAAATATFEQEFDSYTADIESAIAAAAPQSPNWFQAMMFLFQFNTATPQVLQFNTTTFAPGYASAIAADQVIKYCSVVAGPLGTTLIKVAANNDGLPGDLDTYAGTGALAAAQAYANLLGNPAINITVQSGNADVLYCYATIYCQGLYSAIIQSTVSAAITNYLNGIPFNGFVTLSQLEEAILAVPGVNDVVLTNVQAGASGTAYGSGTILVTGTNGVAPTLSSPGVTPTGNLLQRNYSTVAGYISTSLASPYTLSSTLTFISQ